ncbi:unnamed protein product [Chilo suppressalis]|uniref:Mitochondrial carrier protein n=1 Tax=Chilo suppressalis TaxID=168631 RepID=A0ABN8B4S5_CHISP|nr:hypothetical protein evm_005730 [Chilo suppressalis]CAH0402118.1 unnamed protein product [Chilo suppressalis]
MVGYVKDDIMTQSQKLFAGCVSGVMTRFITQPMDVIKIRQQLQKKSAFSRSLKRWFGTTRKIFREEGIRAFWHGYTLGQFHSILSVSSQFYVYEMATKQVENSQVDIKYKPFLLFLCGALAGGTTATIVMPLEVIRLRQMLVKDQYRGFLNGAKAVYRTGGILAFYEGLSASLMQMGPAAGISFSVFRNVQPLILGILKECTEESCKHVSGNVHKPEHLLVASTIAGGIAGFISKTVTYPFDLVKRRLQIASHQEDVRYRTPSTSKHLLKCTSLLGCLRDTYKSEGILGLFRGWKITIYKAQVTSVVAFTTYELMCYTIREFDVR